MTCPKCKSQNVLTQQQLSSKLKTAHHNIIWWIFIGWWWVPVKWILWWPIALLAKIFIPKRQKLKQKEYTVCTCQTCGYSWRP